MAAFLVQLLDGLLWGGVSLLGFLITLIVVVIVAMAISLPPGTGWDPVSLMRHPPGWTVGILLLLIGVFSFGFRHGLRRSRRLHGAAR